MLAVAALAGWLIADEVSAGEPSVTAPRAASVDDLRAAARGVAHAVYWAGPRPGFTYELTHAVDGSFYVRYLPAGVEPGDRRPRFLTIATYPVAAGLSMLAALEGRKFRLPGGGLALISPGHPTSVYLAFPRTPVQVEVYDPSPAVARSVALSGRVVPVR